MLNPTGSPNTEKTEINKQISNMLEDGIIENAQSEWSSPILLVRIKVDSSGEKRHACAL